MQEKSPCCPGTRAAGLAPPGMASRTGLNTTDSLEPLSVPELSVAQEVVGLFCMVLLTFIALVANIVVMVVILKTPLLRKFIFVCHLCVVDLLSAIFLMPLGIISSSSCFNRVIYSIPECQALIFLNICFISASILTISIISVERYYYIVHPMRYEVKMTIRLAVAGVIFIWVKSVLITVLALVGWPQGNGATSASRCTVYWSPGAHKEVFVIIFSIVCFVLPTIVIFAVYCRVYRVARMASLQHVPPAQAVAPRHQSNSIASQVTTVTSRNLPLPRLILERFLGSNKAILTLVLIVGQFLCCWLPFFAFHLHSSVAAGMVSGGHGEMTVTWIAYSSFAINPFFYGLLNRQIREELARLRRSCLNRPLGQEICLSVLEASVQGNFLQFLQRATCTLETHASCISPSPRNRLDQTKVGFPIPGQVPEEGS
ncbi:PREDICTED: LOW QUALITY PROTEIN: probable G-protein coupled receptor [Merops nubicus]|uniref:LOW QUALITY PROTEIN: probable G-protein coupled receptor n=1 Tax=Merops nubicus TaxID=57421 RepID=UPI0004F08706|nr:PREDICTED: LOW QUALITY PROTEIN: probable G-protein coupled receptor [Merops nubicus]